jgi:hypothetical protein
MRVELNGQVKETGTMIGLKNYNYQELQNQG